jgi:hypothetical protein
LSIDPVTTDANTGGSFNRYNYANNNSYKYVDPDGRDPKELSNPCNGQRMSCGTLRTVTVSSDPGQKNTIAGTNAPAAVGNTSTGRTGSSSSRNLRAPDYVTVSVPTPIPSVGVTVTLDRAGNIYLGPSVGASLPGGSGRAAGVGWTGDPSTPTSTQLKDFLGGVGANAGVGIGVTWSSPQAPGNNLPSRMGANIQTPGASVGYNFDLGNIDFGW